MEYIDASDLKCGELNHLITENLMKYSEVQIHNPHSMHNIAAGLKCSGKILVQGSTGFYTGGFLEDVTLIVDGNTGWYAGDNMMSGELIITKNTGSNAGVYFCGGTMVIYGGTGNRAGYGMKGGTIVICGSAGRLAGQMTTGGRLIVLGKVGGQVGESMYKGVIYVQDPEAGKKLGGNVYLDEIGAEEAQDLQSIFSQYNIDADPGKFKAIRPSVSGRHNYEMFHPDLKPELANKPGI